MKPMFGSFFIEIYRDGIIFPFLGRGFFFDRRNNTYGLGIAYIRGFTGILLVMLGPIVFEFRSIGLNSAIYRREARKKYLCRTRK